VQPVEGNKAPTVDRGSTVEAVQAADKP
jgi:hypothetical protein